MITTNFEADGKIDYPNMMSDCSLFNITLIKSVSRNLRFEKNSKEI